MTGYSENFSPFRWRRGWRAQGGFDPAMDNRLLVDGNGQDARSWYGPVGMLFSISAFKFSAWINIPSSISPAKVNVVSRLRVEEGADALHVLITK
jgi:hypothetical protein